VLLESGARSFYDRTLAYQGTRESPFSVWGLVEGLGTAQIAVQVAAVLLALALTFVPRRRDVVSLAALSAAALIAIQLGVIHWFYLYIVWFFPLVLVVLLGEDVQPPWRVPATSPLAREAGSARLPRPASVGTP
jgi:hypothetical protein